MLPANDEELDRNNDTWLNIWGHPQGVTRWTGCKFEYFRLGTSHLKMVDEIYSQSGQKRKISVRDLKV